MNKPFSSLAGRASERGWRVESTVRVIAGTIVLISTILTNYDHRWSWLTLFVGANLLQSGLTDWCLMSNFLWLAGVGRDETKPDGTAARPISAKEACGRR